MEDIISHRGIVLSVTENKIVVSIINESACASCHAKGACSASDMKEKEIEITRFSGRYEIGQPVILTGKTSQGYKAIFYGYILPFVLVLATLVLAVNSTQNEGLSGLLALAILIPYFLTLSLFRNKLKKSFEFEISAIN
jgi:sigma-E factor negative regulatory protein RseC